MNRDQFLLERMKGIGGADAACALGFDPYRTTRELWGIKTGELADDFADNRFTRAGRVLEAAIANLYAEQFGVVLRKKMVPVVHPKFSFMRGNLDRTIVGKRAVLEIKNVDGAVYRTSGEWGEEDSGVIPMRYMIQVRHYLIITGFEVGYVGALVGGNDLKRYVIERDREAEEFIIEGEHEFWQSVVRHEPPELDAAHPSALGLIKRLMPGGNGFSKPLSPEASAWRSRIEAANVTIKELEAAKDEAKVHILKELDGYSFGTFAEGGEVRYRTIERAGFEVKPTSYQDLRFCKTQTKRGF